MFVLKTNIRKRESSRRASGWRAIAMSFDIRGGLEPASFFFLACAAILRRAAHPAPSVSFFFISRSG